MATWYDLKGTDLLPASAEAECPEWLQFKRVCAAILCIAVLEGLSLTLHDLATRSLVAVPAMYAAAILPVVGSLVLLGRRPRRRTLSQPELQAAAS